jgi:D-threo-aldose 1-dehydrogenase
MGCAPLGDLFVKVPELQGIETVAAAWRTGVRLFDTAPWYGTGKSELRLGAGLRAADAEDAIVLTKVGRILEREGDLGPARKWVGGLPFGVRFDYTRDGVLRSFEDSLQRLGRPRVNALAIHDLDLLYHGTADGMAARLRELEQGGFAALEQLRSTGIVDAIGVGINRTGLIGEFLQRFAVDYCIVAMPYTLLSQEGLAELNLCAEHGVDVVIGAPFASGLLASTTARPATYDYARAPEELLAKLRGIEAISEQFAVPVPAAALQFVLGHPAVVTVIPGLLDAVQVEQALCNLERPIPAEYWEALRAANLIHPEAPVLP